MRIFDDLARAQTLPTGHYEIARARAAVHKEYRECHEHEAKLLRPFPKHTRKVTQDQCLRLTWVVCDRLGIRHVRLIHFCSKECAVGTAAHYNATTRAIHLAYQPGLVTMLHEIAHHVAEEGGFRQGSVHGAGFMEAESLVFEIALKEMESWV